MTATERLLAWLLEHPRLRRALIVTGSVYTLCLWAVAYAPTAAAETGAAALGWTGLKDTYNVPLKDYFLSVVDTSEAMTNNGQHISPTDPSTWVGWTADATQVGFSHSLIALVLTAESGALVFLFSLSFWFLRFANSSAWLGILAKIGRPIWAAVNTFVHDMWLGPLAITLCTAVAGYHYMRGRVGRAYSVAGNAAILTALWWTVFRDPIRDLTSEHGLLGAARWTGFHIARSASTTSYAPGQSLDDQLNGLISQLISCTVRPMLQLMNFGAVIDDIPGCAKAWSDAEMNANGQGPGPAHAMARSGCHAVEALAHAQQLGANDIILGVGFLAIGFAIGLFFWYAGITTMVVGVKATYYGVVIIPAFLAGMMGFQRPKRFAAHAGSQLPLHAVQMIIFTTFLAVSVVSMRWALTTPLYGHGQLSVVPRLTLVAIASIVAILAFHHIDKHFYTDSLGTIAHQVSGAWQSTRHGVRAEYDDIAAGLDRLRDGRRHYRAWRHRGNDTDATDTTDDPGHGVPGFDVVKPRPGRNAGSSAQAATAVGEAASLAESAGVVAAAEFAGPAAAAAAAHHLAHHDKTSPPNAHHDGSPADQHRADAAGPTAVSPDTNSATAASELSLPPTATTSRRRTPHDGQTVGTDPQPGSTNQPDPPATGMPSPQGAQPDDPTDDPPLEFPAAPARPPARKGDTT